MDGKWRVDEYRCLRRQERINLNGKPGWYDIIIQKRPPYCDRGDWMIYLDGDNDIDGSDGFPRYFFGTEEEVKQQMETWLNRRQCYKERDHL